MGASWCDLVLLPDFSSLLCNSLYAFLMLSQGMCAEDCAKKFGITREEQDAFCLESYKRSADAWAAGNFNAEVIDSE